MNILITGIHGFVGSNLVSALKNHHTICGLDIVSPQNEGIVKTFGWNELGQVPTVDVIIHLAGKAHDTKNTTNAQVYFDINTGLTQQIFDWFLISNASKFIFFSSVKAAADTIEGDVLTEDIKPISKGPYGESKLAAEKYILSKPLSENKKAYILRPCMIHGPGNKGNLNLLNNLVQKGLPWPLGAFENKRSFTSIDNMAFIIKEIIKKDLDSGIYQVADDETISTKELIQLIASAQKRKTRIWNIPRKLILLSAMIGDVLHLPLNSESLKKLTESYIVSNQKIKTALGIDRMPIRAGEGLKKTIESFKK